MKQVFVTLLFVVLHQSYSTAQQTLDLRQCISFAQENSLTVKQGQLSMQTTAVTLAQSKANRLPNAVASINNSLNSGRSIDLTTYQFLQKVNFLNSLSVGGNVVLYNGGRLNNTIKQNEFSLAANQADINQTLNDLALSVSQAYLSVLVAEETMSTLLDQAKITDDQMKRTLRLIEAGNLPANATLDIEAQQARNEQNMVTGQNNVDLAYLTLKQAMNMDLNANIKISVPANLAIPEISGFATPESIFMTAEQNQHNIKAGLLREEAAKVGVKVAKASRLPTISGSYQLVSNYSALAQQANGVTVREQALYNVDIPGIGTYPSITFSQPAATYGPYSYGSQIKDNFNQQIGINISVPIYDRRQARSDRERAEISVKSAELATQQTRINLKADITRALASAKAALKRYQATRKSVEAQELSFANVQKRYAAGTGNSFEVNTAQNNLAVSKSDLIQAKYDYIFRLKILDFYQGKTISLD